MCTKTPDGIGGQLRIHEGAEAVCPSAPRCLKFGPSRAPGDPPVRHPSAGPGSGTPGAGSARATRSRLACLPPAGSAAPVDA
ncbi:hypothetical protein [Streptomyces sp. NPDC001492]